MSDLSSWRGKLAARIKLQAVAVRRVVYWRKQFGRSKPGTARRSLAYRMLTSRKLALAKRRAQVRYARKQVAHYAAQGAVVKGNTVTGGTLRQRIVAAAEHAAYLSGTGQRHSFYSQSGAWTVDHGITGESPGERSDCSQFVTAMYNAAGAPDPNGRGYRGGYTGTLGGNARYISRGLLKPGDLVLYGPAPHHHVELYTGPGDRTIGHGTRAVDAGNVWAMADPHFATYDFLN